MIGGLGGFVLPIAFGALLDLGGHLHLVLLRCCSCWSPFALGWMHLSIRAEWSGRRQWRRARPAAATALKTCRTSTTMSTPPCARAGGLAARGRARFWAEKGRAVDAATSGSRFPALLLAFSVWNGVVDGDRAPAGHRGFDFAPEQLFLGWQRCRRSRRRRCGSSMASWCRSSADASGRRYPPPRSLLPAIGIGLCPCRTPRRRNFIFLRAGAALRAWAARTSPPPLANIGYFFPKAEKGNATGPERGPGQPWRHRHAVSSWSAGSSPWASSAPWGRAAGAVRTVVTVMQNAGLVWVPFISSGDHRGLAGH